MNSEKVKEIKKGLECCKQNEIEDTCKYCLDCPASDWDYEKECKIDLFQKTITLINELESENKRLSTKIGQILLSIDTVKEMNAMCNIDEQRKQAVKEFAEMLKVKIVNTPHILGGERTIIDETLKEFINE